MRLGRAFHVTSLVAVLLLVGATVATADVVNVNDLVTGSDATKAPGGTGAAKVWLNPSDNATDPQNGCNATGSAPATITLSSSNTSVVTIDTPNSKPVTGCAEANAVLFPYTVSSSATNNQFAILSASVTGGRGGTYNTSDTMRVTVVVADDTPPVIGHDIQGTLGNNGWYTSDVTLTWSVTDSESPNSITKTGCHDQNITADQQATTYSCSASSPGGTAGPVEVTIKRDATAPTDVSGSPNSAPDSNGWYNQPVGFTFTGQDLTSGIAACSSPTYSGPDGTGVAVTGSCTDKAGNESATVSSSLIDYDATAPTDVAFVGGPAAGSEHFFGSVPAAPTCSANDATSGVASCVVTGYSSAVGSHTLTATATDNAGNDATAQRSYMVLPWTLEGFYQPVDINGVWNTVKGGSTVPLKFEVFAGPTELTNVAVVDGFTVKGVQCPSGGVATDDIELVTTGATTLRYDGTGGQFIQNWQTPKKPGACYAVTMKADDGSTLAANFQLK